MKKKPLKNRFRTICRLLKMCFDFYPRLVPLIIFLVLVSAIINSIPSVFQQKVVALIQESYENQVPWLSVEPEIVRLVTILAGLYILSLAAGIFYQQLIAILAQGTLKKLRSQMFEHMQTLPIRYFDTHLHGDVMSYYTNDVDSLRQMISQIFPQLFVSLITLITILGIMMYYSIWMGTVVVIGTTVSIGITKKVGGQAAHFFIAQQKAIGKTEGIVQEMIHGQKVIKVFNHEEQAKRAFDEANEALYESSLLAKRFSNTLMPILNNLSYIIYVFVAIAGGLFIQYHVPNLSFSGLPFSIAVVVPFLGMSRQFSGTIQQISPQINAIVMGLAGAERIFELLDEPSEADDGYVELVHGRNVDGIWIESDNQADEWLWKYPHRSTGEIEYIPVRGDVRFYDVDFAYQEGKNVLHHVTLYGKPGQKIAFVGATGAGKTTITNLINRFYDIADGKIKYDGININKIKKSSLRKSLGIVLQDTVLFSTTVMDNIRYGKLNASDEECIAAAKLAGADDFIRRLPQGYQTILSKEGSGLSQGQCQLLAIARAAVANPPVMIMDEATSSIDTRTEQIVQEGMDRLMYGRTVFVIAHRLSTVKNSDVILVLDQGRIIERGTHDDLLAQKGQYYQLYTGAFELE